MMIKIILAIVNPLANLYLNKMPSATVLLPTRLLLGVVDNIMMMVQQRRKRPGKEEAKDRVWCEIIYIYHSKATREYQETRGNQKGTYRKQGKSGWLRYWIFFSADYFIWLCMCYLHQTCLKDVFILSTIPSPPQLWILSISNIRK